MPDSRPDSTVAIVGLNGDPDMTVAVVGDQVVDLVGSAAGDVLTVQSDGTVAPDPASLSGTLAATTSGDERAGPHHVFRYRRSWRDAVPHQRTSRRRKAT